MKTVIITGGAQGIGRVAAKTLAFKGYKVIILDKDKEAINEMENKNIIGFSCDVGKENDLYDTSKQILSSTDSIVALINNAATSAKKSIKELSLEEWNQIMATNLTSVFLLTKIFEEALRKNKGCIINMASTRALMSEAHTEAYSATKGAIVSLTHALAISLGPDIRVNAISPGWIDVTPYQKESNRKPEELTEEDHLQHPVGRVGIPEDVVEIIEFLIEKGHFITGQNFVVDGGMTKKMMYV
jgi:NAD(P)-dependent dehydrogenase (short-subunit alcohol dehydrogenase family)